MVASLQISNAEATRIAHIADLNEASGKVAIVAASDLHFGLTRMAESQAVATDAKVFRDMEEAREWIGLPQL